MDVGGEKKRGVILASASELFSKNPYHLVSMDEIAKRASVAKGTLYYHFGSKAELYELLITNGMDDILRSLARDAEGARPAESLGRMIGRLVAFLRSRSDVVAALAQADEKGEDTLSPDCRERLRELRMILVGVLGKGKASGMFRKDLDPVIVAEMVLALVRTAVRRGTNGKDAAHITDLLLNGIQQGG